MRIRLGLCVTALLCSLLGPMKAKSQLQKLYLQPKAVQTEKQSRFVDSIRFIPLHTEGREVLGEYNNIVVTKKYFLVVDYTGRAVFVFSKEGCLVNRISYKSLGQEFYPSYQEDNDHLIFYGNNKNYALTPKDLIKIELDLQNPRNRKYFKKYTVDLNDSSFRLKKDKPNDYDLIRAHYLHDDLYWQSDIATSHLYKDSLDFELKIYRDNQVVKAFFPYNRISEPRFLFTSSNVSVSETAIAGQYFATRPYCDTIYRMINDSVVPAYQLVLPLENTLPSSIFKKPFKNKVERQNFEENNGWIAKQAYPFFETPAFIFLAVEYFSNYDLYVYHKPSNTTYKAKNIKTDSTQYNLSFFSEFGFISKGDKMYKFLKTDELRAFFDEHKTIIPPKELESFIKSDPERSKHVIVEFKLKN